MEDGAFYLPSVKTVSVDLLLSSACFQKVNNNRKIILAITNAVWLNGPLWIALPQYRDDFKYHSEIGYAPTTASMSNFAHIINYAVQYGNTIIENYVKSRTKPETYVSAATENNLYKCCYEKYLKIFWKKLKQAIAILLFLVRPLVFQKRAVPFCLRFVDNKRIFEIYIQWW